MTLLLSRSEIESLIDRTAVIGAVEDAHRGLAAGQAANGRASAVMVGDAVFLPMLAVDERLRTATVKFLADLVGVGGKVQRTTLLVCSTVTGECEALLDGRLITAVRTAATSAVATKYLARASSRTLGLVGAGRLAIEHLRALAHVLPVEDVVVWSRSASTVDAFTEQAKALGFAVRALSSPEAVTRAADVLCTLTPSREPLVHGAWFTPGLHVNVVGAPPRADHREVDNEAMARAYVVVDSADESLAKSGDTALAIRDGAIKAEEALRELGDVIDGRTLGRTSPDQITLFNSIGLALQDTATARLLIDRARAEGVGREIDLSA
ncbi:ornithine cyclodeaminase family protein [Frankia sp. AgB1.9]|uniref:ornithine cyclodeaminase family protein n=1 Tax=unclassified Frankia TaxID=2632575 RepID=UPI001931F943|nr:MULTISPECIES: ornithine cyclodeaminase family protein [unclassified Frankia]MBL7492614.1 ornithine cyclodeaminase family protein [Frankia sp. AgW1.1]MBL7549317.1 ornithine cyclodeaminase family protein [Frankia sp. AgB1.9]MBL7619216.1 ornithine cyclodeaminase family protein [Frankia sp. AgB1.8]